MNDELSQRSLELNEVNFFLERMLGAMDPGVVVDGHQKVQVWNSGSAELWSVRPDGAHGQRLWGLDIGLPIDGVRTALREVLAGRQARVDVELDATNGAAAPCHIRSAACRSARTTERRAARRS